MNSLQYEHKYVSRACNIEEKLFQLLFNLTATFFLNASNEFYFKIHKLPHCLIIRLLF